MRPWSPIVFPLRCCMPVERNLHVDGRRFVVLWRTDRRVVFPGDEVCSTKRSFVLCSTESSIGLCTSSRCCVLVERYLHVGGRRFFVLWSTECHIVFPSDTVFCMRVRAAIEAGLNGVHGLRVRGGSGGSSQKARARGVIVK